ncbi:MAG: hypothetical protein ACI35O_14290 [Bacillaceae bacterium]
MKNKRKKILLITTIVGALALPMTANAYSKAYSFDIAAGLDGSTVFSLANKKASTTVEANTYDYSGSVSSSKSKYSVALNGGLLNYYSTGDITANGYSYTKSFGTVSKKDYKLRISKTSTTGDKVKGSGTIKQ